MYCKIRKEVKIENSFIIASVVIVILPLAIMCILCFGTFHGSLSMSSSDWGVFGDFFGGVGSLFLTALNIWIFYKLTKTISEQEEKRSKSQLNFEMQKYRLQKQEELIESFCRAKDKTFYDVDLDNGIAQLNIKDYNEVMEVYNGLRYYGKMLSIFGGDDFRNTYSILTNIHRLLHNSGEDDEYDKNEWEERIYRLYLRVCRIESMLKSEYIQSMNGLIQ